jgi:hypothetical protein
MSCLFHKWNGCKCEVCGKIRDQSHKIELINCVQTCLVCGKHFIEEHDFPETDDCCLICKNCGFTFYNHDWNDFVCVKCGKKMLGDDIFTSDSIQFISDKAKEFADCSSDESFKLSMLTLSKSIKNVNQIINAGYYLVLNSFKDYYENWLIENDLFFRKQRCSVVVTWDNDGNRIYKNRISYLVNDKDLFSTTMVAIIDIGKSISV